MSLSFDMWLHLLKAKSCVIPVVLYYVYVFDFAAVLLANWLLVIDDHFYYVLACWFDVTNWLLVLSWVAFLQVRWSNQVGLKKKLSQKKIRKLAQRVQQWNKTLFRKCWSIFLTVYRWNSKQNISLHWHPHSHSPFEMGFGKLCAMYCTAVNVCICLIHARRHVVDTQDSTPESILVDRPNAWHFQGSVGI